MIGFLSKGDPLEVNEWSGTHYFAYRSLEKHVDSVTALHAGHPGRVPFHKVRAKGLRLLTGRHHKYDYDPGLVKAYGTSFDEQVEKVEGQLDFIYASLTIPEIGCMETEVPIIATADATFSLLKDYYPGHSNLTRSSIRNAYRMEKAGLEKARYLVYPSRWAAESAVNEYNIPEEKVFVQPYGANLSQIPEREQVEQFVEDRLANRELNLLFIGKDWFRKGGPKAYAIKNLLRDLDISCRLNVCGCIPPDQHQDEEVRVFSFLDKSDPEDLKMLLELYGGSHFFLLPTRSECFGVVFNEASAHGLPVLATETGGVPTIVQSDENGFLFPPDAPPRRYAQQIGSLWNNEDRYKALCHQTRTRYEERLSWDAWGKRIKQLVRISLRGNR